MDENEVNNAKEYKFSSPLITGRDSIIDSFFKDCHNIYSHKFKYKCIYDINFENITKKETINLKNSDKSMKLYNFKKII